MFVVSVQITVYVNKVGPYFNPQETYHYYSLPVCRPSKVSWSLISKQVQSPGDHPQIRHASLSLGEVLAGDRKAVSDYSIGFLESFDERTLCTVDLGQKEVDILKEAIEDLYYFEFVFGE